MANLREKTTSDRLVRLASGAALTFTAAMPVLQIALASSGGFGGGRAETWNLVAVAGYLPLHLWHVWYGVRAVRPPAGGWTLTAMAVVIIGVTPLVGSNWLPTYQALIVSAMIVLPGRWSYLCAVAIAAAIAPTAIGFGTTWAWASWATCAVLCRASALLVLVWLAAALHRLQIARAALTQEAVARERRRIDAELRQSVGSELQSIVARGQRAISGAGGDPTALAAQIQTLVDGSRQTLARVRRTVRSYQTPTLRGELESAAILLSAAGMETRLVLSRGDLPESLAVQARSVLSSAIGRLLAEPARGACVITVTRQGNVLRLVIRVEGAGAHMVEVTA